MLHGGSNHPALTILEDLIRIQSVNPAYGDGADGEGLVSDYIEQRSLAAGLKVTRQQVFPGRDNVIAELRVGRPDSCLLFEAHMDTVSLGSMSNPLLPVYQGSRLYGRGACDTKGSLAGMIYAFEECAKNPSALSSDLILCASVDEEHAYKGLLRFLDLDIPISAAVVGEPSELKVIVAHKGCSRFAIECHGIAAHSSMPEKGLNAIYQMVDVLRFITEEYEPSLTTLKHQLCGSPTICVGTIRGGTQVNIVPESCVIDIDRRTIPGEDSYQVLVEFKERLSQFLGAEVSISCKEKLLDWALNTPMNSEIVVCAQKTAAGLGISSQVDGVPYGTDASKLQHIKGIPSIVFGPGSIAQAHSSEEWVSVMDVEKAADFYLNLAKSYRSKTYE